MGHRTVTIGCVNIERSGKLAGIAAHFNFFAVSLALASAGSSNATSSAMIEITTSNSIKVKPLRCWTTRRASLRFIHTFMVRLSRALVL
jgi:hypothetical protein